MPACALSVSTDATVTGALHFHAVLYIQYYVKCNILQYITFGFIQESHSLVGQGELHPGSAALSQGRRHIFAVPRSPPRASAPPCASSDHLSPSVLAGTCRWRAALTARSPPPRRQWGKTTSPSFPREQTALRNEWR